MGEGQNYYQAGTSAEKLRGKYYTPPELVRLVLEQVEAGAGDTIVDPSCGDGEFLVGAVYHLANRGETPSPERLVGVDLNPDAVAECRRRVAAAILARTGTAVEPDRLRIECANALEPESCRTVSAVRGRDGGRLLVVGNPPYVEAKRLPQAVKASLKARYPEAASGAPDLYLYFLHACAEWLRPGDGMALVLPNRVLVNAHARDLRERLLARGQLAGIDFATRANLFNGAGVYPIVLYVSGPTDGDPELRLGAIQRVGDGLRRTALPALHAGAYRHTASRTFFPTPGSPVLAEALEAMVGQIHETRLEGLLDIRWTVSFHRQGLRERYVSREREGMRHARPFLGGGTFAGNGDVTRYRVEWSGWWIDYDTDRLREERNTVPPEAIFTAPKIVICQNGRSLRAALEPNGYILKDTLLCGLLRSRSHPLLTHPRALVGVLCSRAVHFFYSHVFHGGHVNGGYLHFLRTFLNDVPTGHWTDETAASLEAIVRRREGMPPGPEARELEAEAEVLVEEAFGLTSGQRREIAAWAEADENWGLRDRTRGAAGRVWPRAGKRAGHEY